MRATVLGDLAAAHPLRQGWEAFSQRHGGWQVALDRRSALPTLAQGAGIVWLTGDEADPLATLEARARALFSDNRVLLGEWADQLRLDREASGRASNAVWHLTFRQVVDGVPVDGARFDFHVVRGRLVAFGAERWARPGVARTPRLARDEARAAVLDYIATAETELAALSEGELRLMPTDPRRIRAASWEGAWGDGLTHALVWRFRLHAPGEDARWVADVDALTGTILSFHDETHYERVKGGVFPLHPTGGGYEGTEQPDLPMPFADYSINGAPAQTSSAHGIIACDEPGATVTTTLSGPYVRIDNVCGPVSESAICGEDIDLQSGPATNCATPSGASAGNTRSARTAFHQVNRNAERVRYWLPENSWVRSPVTVNVNVNSTCNASWGGELNMYRAGGGCGNTAEIHGVLVHEWGHGMDQNDGGGYDNSSEAYADVAAAYDARNSCIGIGFRDSGTCSGYGDTCLTCSGVRDIDWAQRQFNRPATPQDFLTNQCSGGGGPCGKEVHCESYPAAEALWDFAVRDLPALGLAPDHAWQLADRLWLQSRRGSGGNAYNCALPSSDGCGTNSWFHKLRVADDDDGNLNNGTPHAAAIYAAFARHNIACGAASDASNQNSTSCPALAAPALTVTLVDEGLQLQWAPVENAASYRVLRTDLGCDRAQVPIADVAAPATSFVDTDLGEGVNVSYRVQAVGANPVCESPVSECRTSSVQPLDGRVEFSRSSYACGSGLTIRVRDGNAGGVPLTARVWSDSETVPELVTLMETSPGSNVYEGTLAAAAGAPVAGDGALAASPGDQITARYDDASGAVSVDTALADCSTLPAGNVRVTDITDAAATIRWTTAEPTTGSVEWGLTPALGSTAVDNNLGTEHAVTLNGLNECGRYYFRVRTEDRSGNEAVIDLAGSPFAFNARRIAGFFRDGFEALSGWTLEGEWQVGVPQGRGTSPGDPTVASAGAQVLGHDLTGLGQRPGDYEKSTTQRAISPILNASGKSGVEIKFQRWLNQGQYSTAAVDVSVNGGAWQSVWQRTAQFFPFSASSWSQQTIDIASVVDGASNFRVAFRLQATANNASGASWNVDRFVVRQAADALVETCGGCGGTPSFAGIAAAADADACAAGGGVTLTWDAAASWGSGTAGTYAVYRDTSPNFTPSSGNRLALGLTTTSYTDTGAQDGVTYYYLVRAENNETCGAGPNNNGVVDGNTAYRAVTPASSLAAPGAAGGLVLQFPLGPDLRLRWNPASDAASYRVYRSDGFLPAGFTDYRSFAPAAATLEGDAGDGATWYYLVRGVNGCSQEGP